MFITILRDANNIINAILIIILFTFIRFSALAVKGNFCMYRHPTSCLHQAPHILNPALQSFLTTVRGLSRNIISFLCSS